MICSRSIGAQEYLQASMDSSHWPSEWIVPAWPRHERVHALITTRAGVGESSGVYGALDGSPGLNLGLGSGEETEVVLRNRATLAKILGLSPVWLKQVHGTSIVKADASITGISADASWTDQPDVALGILIADCLPVLFADRKGRVVAAAHAGWRGLAHGVLENTIEALPVDSSDLIAYIGPGIGALQFEVGEDVYRAFVDRDARAARLFASHAPGKWLADLPGLARERLAALDVEVVCESQSTSSAPQLFYSYRRDKATGRMAALIWLSDSS
jgi:polyphenol oxidase